MLFAIYHRRNYTLLHIGLYGFAQLRNYRKCFVEAVTAAASILLSDVVALFGEFGCHLNFVSSNDKLVLRICRMCFTSAKDRCAMKCHH